ncbi:MAG: class I SAM-dependent methyltransferase [Candidatus Taylorbacteria bacterium]|nr:class I SAM-dependent methyltransferase [Candidatus Taylorbacteria bacterium]
MIPKLKLYVRKQQFNPGLLGIFINPFYTVRKELRRAMIRLSSHVTGRTLDVGCGEKPYENIFSNISEYVGMEYDSPKNRSRFKNINSWYDGKHFPFDGNSFDSIILTQVLEHVFNPDEFLAEINRVTKNNGLLLMSAPFVWDEHEQPWDYARYSSFGLKHLLKKHGFEIIEHIKTVSDVRVISQLTACYIHKKLAGIRSYRIKMIFYVLLISPLTIIGTILSQILPANMDLYMDNVVLARKIHSHD